MNNQKPLISVIIPVYKVEKYIKKCIESVLNQTYYNLQIILVDDGSPDNCGKICDIYAEKDNRIDVIHKQNGGLSDARNYGISIAKGEYIGFIDSDDYIENTMYEDLLKNIQKENADVCISNFYNVINGENIIRNNQQQLEIYDRINILKEILLDKKIQSYAWNKLYKKDLFNNIKYPIGRKYEDIGTTFYVFEKCNKVISIPKPEYYYLNRDDSIVNNLTEQTIIDYVQIVDERFDYIKNKYPELSEYNVYYLANILITAFKDIRSLGKISEKLNNIIKNFYYKSKNVILENELKIKKYLNEEQLKQLDILLHTEMYNN